MSHETGHKAFENTKACVFDAYGTLFDVHSAVGALHEEIGDEYARLSAAWRQRQLEYTWLCSLMGEHRDFWRLTSDALRVSLREFKLENRGLHDRLMQAYLQLSTFEEVSSVLIQLKRAELQTAILTNGTPVMIESAVDNSSIRQWIDHQLSVESVGIFKPDPRVYQLAVDSIGVPAGQIAFMSSNVWDASGAAHFGFKVAWINRYSQPSEALPGTPSAMLSSLSELPALLGIC
ncbi:MAG: haloacid dehalogenase type II [Granulosicoccus sp.]